MSDNDDRDMASETLRLADGATGQEVRLAYAVLSAQGHATELAAEVERLTMTNSDLEQWVADFRSKLDEAEKALTDLAPRSLLAEVERLRELSHRWQAVVYAKSFEAAVSIEVRAYHDDECLYQIERDALAATVARVEALVIGDFDPERSDVTVAAIRAAIHPKGDDRG